MTRQYALYMLLAAVLYPVGASAAPDELIPQTTAERHGLARPWFTQVQMDNSRSRISDIVLDRGTLFVQTDTSRVHAIDAETGRTLWARQIGKPSSFTVAPGVSSRLVVVLNGVRLYAVNRFTGEIIYETEVNGAPGAGPAVSDEWVYVPLVTGVLMGYRVNITSEKDDSRSYANDDEKKAAEDNYRRHLTVNQTHFPPIYCASKGRAMVQPILTRQNASEDIVVWPTDKGITSVARLDRRANDRLGMLYRIETTAGYAIQPAYIPPANNAGTSSGTIVVTTRNGFVIAINELAGSVAWRFTVGEPMDKSAVVIDDRVYVVSQLGGMYCLDAKNGERIWYAPRVMQFVSASKRRIFVADQRDQIVALDYKTGDRVDSLPAEKLSIKFVNSDTDRLYLATVKGLVQCFRELDQPTPLAHNTGQIQEKATPQKSGAGDTNAKKPETEKTPDAIDAGEDALIEAAPKQPDDSSADPFVTPRGGMSKAAAAKTDRGGKQSAEAEATKKAPAKEAAPKAGSTKPQASKDDGDPFG
jgi:outer membrane protein assembly factor BamB